MKKRLKETKKFWENNYFLIISLIPLILIILFQPHQISFIPIFFGDEKIAMFDLWSIQHFLAGVLIGSLLLGTKDTPTKNWQRIIPFVLFVAFTWEAVEVYLETGVVLKNWLGFEHWSNRLITDPLMAILGGAVGFLIKDSWRIAVIPMVLWLIFKIILI